MAERFCPRIKRSPTATDIKAWGEGSIANGTLGRWRYNNPSLKATNINPNNNVRRIRHRICGTTLGIRPEMFAVYDFLFDFGRTAKRQAPVTGLFVKK